MSAAAFLVLLMLPAQAAPLAPPAPSARTAGPVIVPPAPPPRPPVDPKALAAARAMVAASGYGEQVGPMAQRMSQVALTGEIAGFQRRFGFPMPADLQGELRALLAREVDKMITDLRPGAGERMAQIYARYFTAAELERLRRLQADPVAVKARQLMPRMLPEMAEIGMAEAARYQPEIQAQAREIVRSWMARNQTKKVQTS